MKELIIKYLVYLKLKDYEGANKIQKEMKITEEELRAIIFEENTKEVKAICHVIDYYLHNWSNLEGLHDKLYELFGSYKEALIWLSENDNIIKNIVLK